MALCDVRCDAFGIWCANDVSYRLMTHFVASPAVVKSCAIHSLHQPPTNQIILTITTITTTMGDDANACRINDLPKVTAILSSEAISKAQAFDMMVRFLQGPPVVLQQRDHPTNDTTDTLLLLPVGRPVPVHHHHDWQDLYHVTETLVDSSTTQQQQRQQLETLRKLRLTAVVTGTTTTRPEANDPTAKMEEDSTERDHRTVDQVLVAVKEEDISPTQDDHDDDAPNRNNPTKKDKKQKKKNKKRHRESVESSS